MPYIPFLLCLIFGVCFNCLCANEKEKLWKLNTSNQGKFLEFKALFADHGFALEATHIDLPEIIADPVTVVVHKASQIGENILVEDTSLEVEGADVGINVRWLLDHLEANVGKKAVWTVLLAYKKNDQIFVYEGVVDGTIVAPRGSSGFGFDPVFLPEGADKTLAEAKPDQYNARAKAVEALIKGNVLVVKPVMTSWNGPWQ